MRLHVNRTAMHMAVVRGHLKSFRRSSCLLDSIYFFAEDLGLVRLLIRWRSRLMHENRRLWIQLTRTGLATIADRFLAPVLIIFVVFIAQRLMYLTVSGLANWFRGRLSLRRLSLVNCQSRLLIDMVFSETSSVKRG